MRLLKVFILFFFLLAGVLHSHGQELKPQGGFLQDSVKVGEQIVYALSFRHTNQEVIFPDSNYNYYPFTFVNKEYFTTRSIGNYAIDSAVYYLTTFEIDTVQPLGLPVFVLTNGDSSAIFAARDTVFFQETVKAIPDSIALKDSSFYRDVPTAINYPYILIGVGILVLVAAIIIIFFGKQIKRRWRHYKLKKEHKQFVEKVNGLIGQMNGNPSEQAGLVLAEWKKYLEMLEKKPFTKLTTKEIAKMNPDERLENALKSLDRSLYGKIYDDNIKDWLYYLLDYSYERYKIRMEEVKYE